MSRVRADDYEDKKQAILDAAAELFARAGYANVRMEEIARACGASKSMLYHYFTRKEDVLFAIMKEQIESHLHGAEAVVALAASPDERLRELVAMWMRRASEARARITVLMYERKFLPRRQQAAVDDVARRLIECVCGLLVEVNPALRRLGPAHPRTYTLLLFGLLNWTEVWFRSGGPIGADEMARLIHHLFVDGLHAVGAGPTPARPARA
jgi:AcrR family transcriptional regulator